MKEQDAAHSFEEAKKNPHEEAIKTLAYRCLQWEDGEIKGYDVQMMDSLLPMMMRPLYDRLEQLSAELTRLRSELQQAKQEIANHIAVNSLLTDSDGEADLANKLYKATSELRQKDVEIDFLKSQIADLRIYYKDSGPF